LEIRPDRVWLRDSAKVVVSGTAYLCIKENKKKKKKEKGRKREKQTRNTEKGADPRFLAVYSPAAPQTP
jgi:hypothetical protein